ncbi:MAG: nucleoside deaminase [Bacteroidales bacterium]
MFSDEYFMREALKEAYKAKDANEIPVGAVITYNHQIIGRGHNLTERLKDVTAHAEIQAITAASNNISSKYLKDCTLYVTLEPCVMCAGAIAWSQISKVVQGASDEKNGFRKYSRNIFHKKTEYKENILSEECGQLMTDFFKAKRK